MAFFKMNPLNIKGKKIKLSRLIEDSKHEWSRKSKVRLNSVHKDLQKVFNLALQISDIDFSIVEGFRTKERQKELYAKGRTKPGNIVTYKDGVFEKSNHQFGRAVDISAYHPNKNITWDKKHLTYIAGVVLSCSELLFANGEIENKVKWGGNWDKDGVILKDHNFIDMPHFEISD